MQPLALSQQICTEYQRYIETTFPILDPKLKQQISTKIEHENLLWKGPYVSLSRPFTRSSSLDGLIRAGLLTSSTGLCFPGWTLYDHQERAIRRLVQSQPTIVASSTGSGKTEAFLIPIIDYCLRHKNTPGTKAVLLYPMNALANDQLKRLRRLLKNTGITFARYTGDTQTHEQAGQERAADIPEEERLSRESIQADPPDILLTNYSMLELLLVRREDQRIFKHQQVRYLVLDEVHTYGGARGIEVACLIRRFKEHVGCSKSGLVCVGTSATVKGEDTREVADFASKLFAETFPLESIILERFDPPQPLAQPYWPPSPQLDAPLLATFDPEQETQIIQLAEQLCSRPLPAAATLSESLWLLFKENALLRLLEQQLTLPCALDELVAYLRHQPQRRESDPLSLASEITAYLLLGTLARNDKEPRLRPKVHMFFRGLEGFTRCLECDHIWDAGISCCPDCQGFCLPVEVCRSCGQDFFRAQTSSERDALTDLRVQQLLLATLGEVSPYQLEADESRDSGARTLHITPEIHRSAELFEDEEDEEDEPSAPEEADSLPQPKRASTKRKTSVAKAAPVSASLQPIYICSVCGLAHLKTSLNSRCTACENPLRRMWYLPGRLSQCPACRGRYGSREIVTAFGTSVAASVSVLSSGLMKQLAEHERRLLIFSDNRQDTAFQAGYLSDKHGQFTKRQLIYQVILDEAAKGHPSVGLVDLPKLFYNYAVALGLFERDWRDREREERITEETWPILAEFARGGSRRVSLEGLGLLRVHYSRLHETLLASEEATTLAAQLGLSSEELYALSATLLDEMRTRRALDHQLLIRPIQFREEKVEGFDRDLRPVGYGERSVPKLHAYKILPITTKSGTPTQFQVYLRKVLKLADNASAIEPVKALIKLLTDLRYISDPEIGKPEDKTHALMVNHKALEIVPVQPGESYECNACRRVYTHSLSGICPATRCAGTLQPLRPHQENYYVHTYLEQQLVRLNAHEHSGQLDGKIREQYEEKFRQGEINILVCTPTLELGVDIGDLPIVMMRNIPPGPANYAQRSGRAGRAERIALIVSFARNRGHDSYYYDKPAEMIRGVVRAPVFGFDNQRIIQRHLHALILENLTPQFPSTLGKLADDEDHLPGIQPFIADLKNQRSKVQLAVADAFARDINAGGLSWLTSDYVGNVIDAFPFSLERAFRPWLVERRNIIETINSLPRLRLNQEQQRRVTTLQTILYKLEQDPLRAYPLSYLARQGFLPAYAFVGDQARMIPLGETRDPLMRGQDSALYEFAPGNLIYCDGNVYSIIGLDFQRSDTPEQDAQYRLCDRCGMVTFNAVAQYCESCNEELKKFSYIEARSFLGSKTRSISAAEESRASEGYETHEFLLEEAAKGERRVGPAGFDLAYHRNTTIFSTNAGFIRGNAETRAPRGFSICTTCGQWQDPHQEDWEPRHRKRCTGTIRPFHLGYKLETDVLEIDVPGKPATSNFVDKYLITLRNALVLGANLALQTEEGEIEGFERVVSRGVYLEPQIILYDDVPGGAGYVERLSTMLPDVAAHALERLIQCACVDSCYRCLRSYRNQAEHKSLDKRLVLEVLQRISDGVPGPSLVD